MWSGPLAARPVDRIAPGAPLQTLLVLEDEDAVRRLMVIVLEGAGYRVLQACDPATALAVAQSFPDHIHLLISDLTMPEMDGREVARAITGVRPECRVLIVSGYPADTPAGSSPAQAAAFLQKPFVPRVLLERVRELIGS